MAHPRVHRLVVALAALLILPACSAGRGNEPVAVTTPYAEVTPSAIPSTERPSVPSTSKPLHNDLKKGRLTRKLKAGSVRATVRYSLQNRVEKWVPGVAQPLKVSVSAHQPGSAAHVTPA